MMPKDGGNAGNAFFYYAVPKIRHPFAGSATLEPNVDRVVRDCRGEIADSGHSFGQKTLKSWRAFPSHRGTLVPRRLPALSTALIQLLLALFSALIEDRVVFPEKQARLVCLDCAKQRCRRRSNRDPGNRNTKYPSSSSRCVLPLRGSADEIWEVRRHIKGREGVSVRNP